MKGFFIEVTNDLLDKKHRKAMGTAVWEFMWCLDKITKIDGDIGYVFGGSPVNLLDIKKDLGIDENHISENLIKLENCGYISKTRTPYGIIILVNKAKKRFHQKVVSPSKKVETNSKKVVSIITKTIDKSVDTTFGIFWSSYPRKVSRKTAEKVWTRIKPDDEKVARIMAALERHKMSEQWTKDDGRFVPHPTTWLNQERWEDELKPAKAVATFGKYNNIKEITVKA